MGAINLGTSLLPVLTGAASVIQSFDRTVRAVQNVAGVEDQRKKAAQRAAQDLALKQLQEKQALQEGLAQKDADLERERAALESDSAESKRRAALKRAVARQRAEFGAEGIDATGGSAEAVLLGLFDESEDDLRERERLDSLRSRVVDQNLSGQKSLNLLQATQLAERQKLERISEGF